MAEGADILRRISVGEAFGIQAAIKKIDFKTIIDNKNSCSEKIRPGMEGLLQNNGVEVRANHAGFKKTVEAFWVIFVLGK